MFGSAMENGPAYKQKQEGDMGERDKETERRARRAQHVLLKARVTTRKMLVEHFDKGRGVRGLKGIGPVLTRFITRSISDLNRESWERRFPHIAWE